MSHDGQLHTCGAPLASHPTSGYSDAGACLEALKAVRVMVPCAWPKCTKRTRKLHFGRTTAAHITRGTGRAARRRWRSGGACSRTLVDTVATSGSSRFWRTRKSRPPSRGDDSGRPGLRACRARTPPPHVQRSRLDAEVWAHAPRQSREAEQRIRSDGMGHRDLPLLFDRRVSPLPLARRDGRRPHTRTGRRVSTLRAGPEAQHDGRTVGRIDRSRAGAGRVCGAAPTRVATRGRFSIMMRAEARRVGAKTIAVPHRNAR